MPPCGMKALAVLNFALLMVLSKAVMNLMTITATEAKKYEKNEQVTKVRHLNYDI